MILASGIGMGLIYIESPQALYGTAYGTMLVTKISLFAALLLLGWMNKRTVDRLGRDPATPTARRTSRSGWTSSRCRT